MLLAISNASAGTIANSFVDKTMEMMYLDDWYQELSINILSITFMHRQSSATQGGS